ncbi:MAG: S41 family peptidase [Planctomycetota bacterium]|jgi:thiol-disulfide isomerase/thioredoxin
MLRISLKIKCVLSMTIVVIFANLSAWGASTNQITTAMSPSCSQTCPANKDQQGLDNSNVSSTDLLDFRLKDIFGRIVDSRNYLGVPVLIVSGSCWCGDCQKDMKIIRKIEKEYTPRGLAIVRNIVGDNELAALDFKKHYRLPFVHLLDTNRRLDRRYNKDGWTFLMLADRDGKIIYQANSPSENDWRKLKSILNNILQQIQSHTTINRDDTIYMTETLKDNGEFGKQLQHDRFPSIAAGRNGQIYLVFTTNRNGNSDIYIRIFDGLSWSEDMPIAATNADEYDATVLVDKQDNIWVSWTSNADGKNYNIFIVSFDDLSRIGKPTQLTNSEDDAMHARIACDSKGRIWVVYYKWQKIEEYSRDKEIYIRRYENGNWSSELQVSPTDVSAYEDHSDPAITVYASSAVIAWSWDFHPPNKGYSTVAESPTIFIRPIFNNMKLGKISSVSSDAIDLTPNIIISQDRKLWCTWDSILQRQSKYICITQAAIGRNNIPGRIQFLDKAVDNICTPSFAMSPQGSISLFWSENVAGRVWILKKSCLDQTAGRWGRPEIIELQHNPRYCSAVYDSEEQIWIAYSAESKKGGEIVVKKLKERFSDSFSSLNSKTSEILSNIEATQKLRKLINQNYSYRDIKKEINWDKLFKKYLPLLERTKSKVEFAEIASEMTRHAKDMHLWVKVDGETVNGFKRRINRNYNISLLPQRIPSWKNLSDYVSIGRFDDGVGYILIKNWLKDRKKVLEPALKALEIFATAPALIIDVRPNSGGSEPYAREFAGCFIDKPVVYAKHSFRNANRPDGWDKIQDRMLIPNHSGPKYRGGIAVLMGQANMSSCEAFLLMMKQVRNCKLVGERSYGSSGNPKPFGLDNGVTIWLPSWKALRADGSHYEGEGIIPDINVKKRNSKQIEEDTVLEAALNILRKPLH